LNLKNILGKENNQILSYGPCQFPTLGFIVERYHEIKEFDSQNFWSLNLKITKQEEKSS
jgi:DNA topoisomerase-3